MAGPSSHKEPMELYEQKECQFEMKWTEIGQTEGRLLDFLDLTGLQRAI